MHELQPALVSGSLYSVIGAFIGAPSDVLGDRRTAALSIDAPPDHTILHRVWEPACPSYQIRNMEVFAGLGGGSFATGPNQFPTSLSCMQSITAALILMKMPFLRTNGTAAARMAGAYHMPS